MDSPSPFHRDKRYPLFFNAPVFNCPTWACTVKDHLKTYLWQRNRQDQSKWQQISLNQHDYLLEIPSLQDEAVYASFLPGYLKPLAKTQYREKRALIHQSPQPDPCYRFPSFKPVIKPTCLWSYVTVGAGRRFPYKYRTGNPSLKSLIIAVLSTIPDPLYSSTDDPVWWTAASIFRSWSTSTRTRCDQAKGS